MSTNSFARNEFFVHFPEDIATFLRYKSIFLNSSIGNFTPALLITTACLSKKNRHTVEMYKSLMQEQPMNIYGIFVGYPGTGKSSAIQHGCLEPMAKFFEFCVTEQHPLVSPRGCVELLHVFLQCVDHAFV